MCRFSTVKKKFFNVLLVLAIVFIAGSCNQPSGGGNPGAPVPPEPSHLPKITKAVLREMAGSTLGDSLEKEAGGYIAETLSLGETRTVVVYIEGENLAEQTVTVNVFKNAGTEPWEKDKNLVINERTGKNGMTSIVLTADQNSVGTVHTFVLSLNGTEVKRFTLTIKEPWPHFKTLELKRAADELPKIGASQNYWLPQADYNLTVAVTGRLLKDQKVAFEIKKGNTVLVRKVELSVDSDGKVSSGSFNLQKTDVQVGEICDVNLYLNDVLKKTKSVKIVEGPSIDLVHLLVNEIELLKKDDIYQFDKACPPEFEVNVKVKNTILHPVSVALFKGETEVIAKRPFDGTEDNVRPLLFDISNLTLTKDDVYDLVFYLAETEAKRVPIKITESGDAEIIAMQLKRTGTELSKDTSGTYLLPLSAEPEIETKLLGSAVTGKKLEIEVLKNNGPFKPKTEVRVFEGNRIDDYLVWLVDDHDPEKWVYPKSNDEFIFIAYVNDVEKKRVTLKMTDAVSEDDVSLADLPIVVGTDLDTWGTKIAGEDSWLYDKNQNAYFANPIEKNFPYALLLIKPTNPNATIEVSTGDAFDSIFKTEKGDDGFWSKLVSMKYSENVVQVTVTSADKKKAATYTVYLFRDVLPEYGAVSPLWYSFDDGKTWGSMSFDTSTKKSYVDVDDPTQSFVNVQVRPKMVRARLGLDDEAPVKYLAKKTVDISAGRKTNLAIKVLESDQQTVSDYSMVFTKPIANTLLKSLTIDKAPNFSFDKTQHDYTGVAVPQGTIVITAIPADSGAQVEINDQAVDAQHKVSITFNTDRTYTIKVSKDGAQSTYRISLIAAVTAGTKVSTKIYVADSVGGTKVSHSTLHVYKTGEPTATATTTVNDGIATVQLDPNDYYDFELVGVKGEKAGSRLENYYIDGKPEQELSMLQFRHGQINRDVKPPKVLKATYGYSGKTLQNGTVMTNSVNKLSFDFESPSAAIWPIDGGSPFGAKLGLGTAPSTNSGIEADNISKPKKDSVRNVWVQKNIGFTIYSKDYVSSWGTLKGSKLPAGKMDIIVVAYDTANNRLERHYSVEIAQESEGSSLELAKFTDIFMITERVPYSMNTFALPKQEPDRTLISVQALNPIGGRPNSYKSIIQFSLVKNGVPVEILGFDLYRRKDGETTFKKVTKVIYGKLQKGYRGSYDWHQGSDSDSLLEENGVYEYKIIAYNESSSVESKVFKGKIMPAFTYSLNTPRMNGTVPKDAALNPDGSNKLDFSCTVDNTELLKAENADFINFGIIVLDKRGTPYWSSRCNYIFDAEPTRPGNQPDIDIFLCDKVDPKYGDGIPSKERHW